MAKGDEKLAMADVVISGEGCFDATTQEGKVIDLVKRKIIDCVLKGGKDKKFIVACGLCEVSDVGDIDVYSLVDLVGTSEAMGNTIRSFKKMCVQIFDDLLIQSDPHE
ncbi:Glycerate kinase like protein [Aduncisulcus paluster]|uniref:Glycerate kinase like protein n=1 Tax=Aduncisulcus paluster TaxID=2918883 RepID=A0ABQ5KSS2_9EUKA|nr:Glycerate kinase like protein [Aduncisulcus paluster]